MLTKVLLFFFIIYLTKSQVNAMEEGVSEQRRNRRHSTTEYQRQSDISNVASSSNAQKPTKSKQNLIFDLNKKPDKMYYKKTHDHSSKKSVDRPSSSTHDVQLDFHIYDTSQRKTDEHFEEYVRDESDEATLDLDYEDVNEHNENLEFNDPAESIYSGVDLKNHKFISSHKQYSICHGYYHKNPDKFKKIIRKKRVRTRCLECNKNTCADCFQVEHGLDSPPTIYPWQQIDKVPDQTCFHCNTTLGNDEDEIFEHVRTCDRIPVPENGGYGCYACHHSCKLKDSLKKHFRKHTGFRPYICNYEGCQYAAKVASTLSSHLRNQHGLKKWNKVPAEKI